MNNLEKINLPEIKTEELLSVIDQIIWEDYHQFSFNGTNYQLILIEKEIIETGKAGGAAEFYKSTVINGYDIYLFETIPEVDRKRILFHEILEANLIDQGFKSQAHQITLDAENKCFNSREK